MVAKAKTPAQTLWYETGRKWTLAGAFMFKALESNQWAWAFGALVVYSVCNLFDGD